MLFCFQRDKPHQSSLSTFENVVKKDTIIRFLYLKTDNMIHYIDKNRFYL